jgi:cytoskeletal protein CcmA (bactofilin family)
MSGKRKWWPILGMAVVLLLLINLTIPVFAGENRTGGQVTVGPNEVLPDDLYATGDIITIDGTIKGDLIAFASEIRINGTVEGQVLGAARTIWVNGTVNDDVRVAAYQLQIGDKGHVAHDVNVAAFSFEALNGSNIGGDVYAVAYQGQLNGKLGGSYRGATNGLYIDGEVGHDVLAEVARADPEFNQLQPFMRMSPVPILGPGLHIADTAVISGALKYVSRGEAIIAPGAKISQVIREAPAPTIQPQRERPPERGFGWLVLFWIIAQLRRLFTLIIIGLLLVWLLPRFVPEAAARLRARPWPSLGWGCVGEIAFFVTLPIIFAVIIGLGLLLGIITLGGLQTVFIGIGLVLEGLWGLIFAVVTSYVAKIVIAFLIGTLLLEQARSKSVDSAFWPLIIGIVLYIIVAAIPILGWFATLAATLFGLGALWLWLRDQWWPPSPAMVAAPAGGPASPIDVGRMSRVQDYSATMSPPYSGPVVEETPAPPSAASGTGGEATTVVPLEELPIGEEPPIPPWETIDSAAEPPPDEPSGNEESPVPANEVIVPPAEPHSGEEPPVPPSEVIVPPTEPHSSEQPPVPASEVIVLLVEPVPSEETAPTSTDLTAAAPAESTPPAPEGATHMPGENEENRGEPAAGSGDGPESTSEDQSQRGRRRRPRPKGDGE